MGDQKAPAREYIHAARDRMDETYDLIRAVRDKRYKYLRNYMPERTYAQTINTMELMPTMQEWRRLHAEGKLEGPQKIFFSESKPVEELYDTEADPHEVVNLADSPEHQEILARLRREHEKWRKETNDRGLIPEPELMERMRPGGKYEVTATPMITPEGGSHRGAANVKLDCATEGASIAYTTEQGEDPYWKLYSGGLTLSRSATLRTKAIRIGFKESKEAMASFRIG